MLRFGEALEAYLRMNDRNSTLTFGDGMGNMAYDVNDVETVTCNLYSATPRPTDPGLCYLLIPLSGSNS